MAPVALVLISSLGVVVIVVFVVSVAVAGFVGLADGVCVGVLVAVGVGEGCAVGLLSCKGGVTVGVFVGAWVSVGGGVKVGVGDCVDVGEDVFFGAANSDVAVAVGNGSVSATCSKTTSAILPDPICSLKLVCNPSGVIM